MSPPPPPPPPPLPPPLPPHKKRIVDTNHIFERCMNDDVISWEPLMEKFGEKLKKWGTKKKRSTRITANLPEKVAELGDLGEKGGRKPRSGKDWIFGSEGIGNPMLAVAEEGNDVAEGD